MKFCDWIWDYMVDLCFLLARSGWDLILGGIHDHRLFECISRDLKQLLSEGRLSQTQKAWVDDFSSTESMSVARPWTSGLLVTVSKSLQRGLWGPSYSYILCFCVVSADVYWVSRAQKIHFPNKSFLVSPMVYSLPAHLEEIYKVGGNWEWWVMTNKGYIHMNIFTLYCYIT